MRKYPRIGLWIGVFFFILHFPFSSSGIAVEPELKLALRIVSFQTPQAVPVLSPEMARALVEEVNGFFTSCRVSFLLERLENVNPESLGLPERPSTLEELDPIRARLKDSNHLLIVQTGPWRGTLAAANAWTVLPGDGPLGTVMESTYARHARLVAHELAHALDRDHVTDRNNLLHPVLHPDSSGLTQEQCSHLRSAAQKWHSLALRDSDFQPNSGRNLASAGVATLQAQGELKDRHGVASRR